jgi:hypothetical protein
MQDRNGSDSAYLVPGTGYLASGTRSVFILHHAYPMGAFFEDKCQVPGTRYRVPSTWDRVPGTRHRMRSDADDRCIGNPISPLAK